MTSLPTDPPAEPGQAPAPQFGRVLARMTLRLATIIAVAVAISALISLAQSMTENLSSADQNMVRTGMVVASLLIYAVLMTLPFVPGIEIGLALLMMRGPEIAPAVYIATASGLSLAFLIGWLVPIGSIGRLFADLRLNRAAGLIARLAPLAPEERAALLEARLPTWARLPFARLRYIGLAVLFNIPGNALIGGGGGIALMAGISGVFRPTVTLTTIWLAVLPAPLIFWLWGDMIPLDWLPLPA